MNSNEARFLMYRAAEDEVAVNALVKDDTIWLNQKAMAELFDCSTDNISLHLKNIFAEGELAKEAVTEKISATASDGKTYATQFYNLDAIISVGYRVNSHRATAFRIWATGILREYMIKGFAMDDERLKQGQTLFGKDYFRELLERVRSIRASERRIWQQVTDIYAECSIDYDPKAPTTKEFYAMVQNKFHYAIVGKTAAEIVYDGADHTRENMGLTTWKNAPDGRILKSDTSIAKDYLDENDVVLIVDDFLANGNAVRGLMSIVEQAGAKLAGVAIAIEKGFQDGGKKLREDGVHLESMAIVDGMDALTGEICFREE